MQPHAAAGPALPAATGLTAGHGFDAPAAATLAPRTVAPCCTARAASNTRTATRITGPALAPCADAALPIGLLAQPALQACYTTPRNCFAVRGVSGKGLALTRVAFASKDSTRVKGLPLPHPEPLLRFHRAGRLPPTAPFLERRRRDQAPPKLLSAVPNHCCGSITRAPARRCSCRRLVCRWCAGSRRSSCRCCGARAPLAYARGLPSRTLRYAPSPRPSLRSGRAPALLRMLKATNICDTLLAL